jgi:uncharacterized RDD family membrane protein YckC
MSKVFFSSIGLVIVLGLLHSPGDAHDPRALVDVLASTRVVAANVPEPPQLSQTASESSPATELPPLPELPAPPGPPVVQEPPQQPTPEPAQTPEAKPDASEREVEPAEPFERPRRDIVRFGSDFTLPEGEAAGDVVVMGGSVTIAGRTRDLVVILGSASLASTAAVEGDMVVVGGGGTIESGAVVERDLVVVGGALEAPVGFAPGGEQVKIGTLGLGEWFAGGFPWLTRGLLWGRVIVPDLPWNWLVAAVVLLVYLAMNAVFLTPVGAAKTVLSEKPLTSFLIGLLVLLATGPVALVLMLSVIGIVVIPFALCALLLAGLAGKVAAVRWIGANLIGEDEAPTHLQATRSLVVGFVLVCLIYMVPILGMIAWVSLGVLGLGAATLAFSSGLRRENPAPPRPSPPPVPFAPPPLDSGTLPSGSPAPDSGSGAPAGAASAAAGGIDMTSLPRATFLNRLAALILDFLLVLLTFGLLGGLDDDQPGRLLLLLLVYHIVFWAWKGTTVGGIICQLRVIRVDGSAVRFVDALVRGLSSIFSAAVVGLGFLWILKEPDRQAWHDKIAGTYVVAVPKAWPLP